MKVAILPLLLVSISFNSLANNNEVLGECYGQIIDHSSITNIHTLTEDAIFVNLDAIDNQINQEQALIEEFQKRRLQEQTKKKESIEAEEKLKTELLDLEEALITSLDVVDEVQDQQQVILTSEEKKKDSFIQKSGKLFSKGLSTAGNFLSKAYNNTKPVVVKAAKFTGEKLVTGFKFTKEKLSDGFGFIKDKINTKIKDYSENKEEERAALEKRYQNWEIKEATTSSVYKPIESIIHKQELSNSKEHSDDFIRIHYLIKNEKINKIVKGMPKEISPTALKAILLKDNLHAKKLVSDLKKYSPGSIALKEFENIAKEYQKFSDLYKKDSKNPEAIIGLDRVSKAYEQAINHASREISDKKAAIKKASTQSSSDKQSSSDDNTNSKQKNDEKNNSNESNKVQQKGSDSSKSEESNKKPEQKLTPTTKVKTGDIEIDVYDIEL